jgi:tRNA-dihydrouridine synthase
MLLTPELRAKVAIEHSKLFEKTYSNDERYNFLPMRKHLSWYTHSFPQAREIRSVLVRSSSSLEAESIFQQFGLLPN